MLSLRYATVASQHVRSDRRTALLSAGVALAVGALGFAGGVWGAKVGGDANVRAQREELRYKREDATRQRRAKVYTAFLDQSTDYRFAAADAVSEVERLLIGQDRGFLSECLAGDNSRCKSLARRITPGRRRRVKACFNLRGCRPVAMRRAVSRFVSERSDFQGALNDVYIYGTARAYHSAGRLAGALPPSVYDGPDDEIQAIFEVVDPDGYRDGYNAFLELMCRELPAQPRRTCKG